MQARIPHTPGQRASGSRRSSRFRASSRTASGIKDASLVKRYGIRLLPELYAYLNPMPFEAAAEMERDLAEDLRRSGYTVTGGH